MLRSVGRAPRASYYELTRSGQRKGPATVIMSRRIDGAVKRAPNVIYHWLSFYDGAWRMAPSFRPEVAL